MSVQELIDRFDWSRTPIGPRESWPQSLRTALSICVHSRFPILIWWGPQLTMLYNDAYAAILGSKHPAALGGPGSVVWHEIWRVIGPMLDQVRYEGIATWSDDQFLLMDRYGFDEETYFTFSYSPIHDESGGIGGIFTAVTETTTRVVGERRLDTLRQLAARRLISASVEEACANALDILRNNTADVPFAAIRLRGEEAGDTADTLAFPLKLPGDEEPAGELLVRPSTRRPYNDAYRAFFSLAASHIAAAIADARAYEMERQRAEALAELDRAKTAFFSNVSHEFRTPLTLMLGPIEDLLAQELAPETRARIELAHRNALRLLKLVNMLLDFSRIEAGRIEAVYEPVDLAQLTAGIAAAFRSATERAGLQLIVDCPPLREPVYVDRELWEKVVLNLLSNAFKFTFHGAIEVTLRERGGHAELTVRDTGTGIPAAELAHVFERFHRVKGARGRTHEGSGIGLALVQELVKLHGGSVGVTSEVDHGSTFTVSIPFGRAHLAPERVGAPRTAPSPALHGDSFAGEAARWIPTEVPEVRGTEARTRILLADDNADMRDYVRRLLGTTFDVEVVSDGVEALNAARERTPDVILSDVMMPRMDGFELLRAVRSDERLREVPVILLSARAGEESRVEGLDAGADDYLVKPFSARELLARVQAHVRLQRLRRDAQRALRESEAKFATAFDRSPLALTITSLEDGRLIEINKGFIDLTGYRREEVIGRSPEDLGLWIDPAARHQRFDHLRAGDEVPDIEARFRLKNGEERIGFIGSARVEINGRPCVLSSVSDITDRKRAEEAVRESEARLREFANTAPAMLWITETDGSCTFISRGWYEFTGQSEAEALGFGWLDALHDDDHAPVREAFLAANAKQEAFTLDMRVRDVRGEYSWVVASGRPRFASGGAFAGYVGSVIDITDRKRAEQAKDEFLATLSHELRTPLTSGYGWVKLLGRAREPELLETGLGAIEESLVNQMKLVDDLLDISRIAAGKIRIDVQPLDLGSVIEAAVEMVRPSVDAKHIALRVHMNEPLSVRGDASRLKQVFWNVLSNAIKFTPVLGEVHVGVRRVDDRAEIAVRDTGEGIDAKFLPHVFDRFRQADASTTRRHGGLGIGLSIVASLVDAHGGSVRAESEGLSRGATFTVTLPLIERRELMLPRGPDASPAILTGTRLVVVDDDDGTRRIVRAVLEAAGAEVRECVTVEDAYDTVAAWRPDILISDLAMPDQDGYSLIRRLRDAGQTIPALAITAHVRPEDELRVREAGFARHVAKPFDPDELVRAVEQLRA